MSFDTQKHKIEFLWNEFADNKDNVDKLIKYDVRFDSVASLKNIREIIIPLQSHPINSDPETLTQKYFEVTYHDVPLIFLPFFHIVLYWKLNNDIDFTESITHKFFYQWISSGTSLILRGVLAYQTPIMPITPILKIDFFNEFIYYEISDAKK